MDKHFALIIIIPLLMFGAFYYIENNITGFAIVEASNSVGNLLYSPSVELKSGFSGEELINLKSQLRAIIESCKSENMQECVKSKTINWQCEPDSFLEYFNSLLEKCALGNKGICNLSLSDSELLDGTYDVKISLRASSFYSSFYSDKLLETKQIQIPQLYFSGFEDKDENKSIANEISMVILAENKKISIKEIYTYSGSSRIDLSKKFVYVSDGNIKFIDELEQDSFKNANIEHSASKVNGMKFCAKSSDSEHTYKFAVKFE